MARNGSGVYSLPAGSVIANGDTSDAADLNVPLADLEADMNTARPIVAGGTGADNAPDARTNLGLGSSSFVTFGAISRGAPVTKTADFTVAATENWLINNKASTACTVTLPAAASFTGREIMIQNQQDLAVNSASSNVVPLRGGSAGTAILPATNGAWATLVSDGSNWQIVAQSSNINLGVAVASTSGTAIDFTGIPSWARRVTVMLDEVSTNGTSPIVLQVGNGSLVTSGYSSRFDNFNSTIATQTATTSFGIFDDVTASTTQTAVAVLSLLGNNIWLLHGTSGSSTPSVGIFSGRIALGSALDRVRITTAGGVNTFDAGSINISWE